MLGQLQFPQVLVEGRLDREQVRVRYLHSEIRPTDDQNEYIHKQWLKYVDDCSASKLNVRPYPGKLFRLLDLRPTGPILELTLGDVSFDQYHVSRTSEFIEKFGDIKAIPVAVVAVVTTSDNYVVLGQGKLGTEKVGTIAGCMEREDPETHEILSAHPFDQIERELTEEAGVNFEDIQRVTLLGVLGRTEPLLVFDIRLNITSETLARERTPSDMEFKQFFSICNDADSIRDFMLKNESNLTSDCLSALLLWGKHTFEPNWFETVAARTEPPTGPTLSQRLPPNVSGG